MRLKLSVLSFVFYVLFLTSCNDKGKETTTTPVADDDASMVYVRKNANSPDAKADLEAMAVALQKMREMDCTNPASWYYQGAIHWMPDTVFNGNPLCPSYVTKSQLKLAWDNCTHAEGANSDFNFLIWHRFYTMHFEQIVRDLSGKKDFAIPYWDYTDTTNIVVNRTMPEQLRTLSSSLYDQSRLPSLNNGDPIASFMNSRLDITQLMQESQYFPFCNSINGAPHGVMHNYIGAGYSPNITLWNQIYQDSLNQGGGLMANVQSAGFDPVFWLHHANIDRLWQMWTDMDNSHLVNAADVVAHPWPYIFFTSTGDTIQYTMEQVAAQMYNVNYVYTGLNSKPASADMAAKQNLTAQVQATADTLHTAKVSKKANMKNKLVAHTLKLEMPKAENLKSVVSAKEKTIMLQVVVSFTKEPKNDYQLFMNLPKGESPNVKSPYFVGWLSFFGAAHHAKSKMTKNGLMTKTFYFDVTDEINEGKVMDQKDIQLSLYLAGEIAEDGITVESYKLYTK